MADEAALNEAYKKHFGVDFTALDEKKRALAEQYLNDAVAMNGPSVLIKQDGSRVENPAIAAFKSKWGELTPQAARDIGVYAAYKRGELPPSARDISDEEIKQHKLPPEAVKKYRDDSAARAAEWKQGVETAYNRFVPTTSKETSDKEERALEIEPEQITAKADRGTSKAKGKQGESTATETRDGVQIPKPSAKEQAAFDKWAKINNVNDPFHPDQHYDYVSAFRAGVGRDKGNEHFPDTFKLPGHETFSNQSQYATGDNAAKAGQWAGEQYLPPGSTAGVEKLDSIDGKPGGKTIRRVAPEGGQ